MYPELGVKYWRYHKNRALFILFSIFLNVAALDFVEPTYEAEGTNWPQYCFAKRKKLEVTVGAVIVVKDEMAQQKYLYNYSGVFPWNVVVSNETFANWGLPDNRYSKLWVSCREGADVTEFERLWYRVLLHGRDKRTAATEKMESKFPVPFYRRLSVADTSLYI